MDTIEVTAIIAKRLREAKEKAGVSQRQMGEQIGVSGPMIMKYLQGKHSLRISDFVVLCRFLNVKPADILKGLDNA